MAYGQKAASCDPLNLIPQEGSNPGEGHSSLQCVNMREQTKYKDVPFWEKKKHSLTGI